MGKRGSRSLLGENIGSYHVKYRLGQGGMGEVYLARDKALERMVALKILLPRHADDGEFIARFQREARASAKLNHPHIVQIYTVDVESDPPFMAMEYVDGENLETYIRRQGKLSWQRALNFVSHVAAALECAHAAGIIHRDIKPANVLVEKSGRARVTDFGIAKIVGSQTNLTGTQHTVGSPSFMSPEQCGVGEVVPASDLFSLGVMLYEMVSGEIPFKAESSIAVMRKIVDEDVPRLSEKVAGIPPEVDRILETLTARDLKARYSSATQVLEDLKAYRTGNTMGHMQSLHFQRAAHAPASASAADLTRSPTGRGAPLSDSLVAALMDDTEPRAPLPPVRNTIEVPWMGILVAATVLLFGALGVLYYQGVQDARPGVPPERDGQTGVPPRTNNERAATSSGNGDYVTRGTHKGWRSSDGLFEFVWEDGYWMWLPHGAPQDRPGRYRGRDGRWEWWPPVPEHGVGGDPRGVGRPGGPGRPPSRAGGRPGGPDGRRPPLPAPPPFPPPPPAV